MERDGPAVAPGRALDPGNLRAALGKVASFDAATGLGELEGADGTRHRFHCTAIWGGTRDIAPGTWVTFRLAPAHGGRFDAADLQPAPAGESAQASGGDSAAAAAI